MTNQEINQLYWTLPEHFRTVIDTLLASRMDGLAALILIDGAKLYLSTPVGGPEALAWAEWRISLRSMSGR